MSRLGVGLAAFAFVAPAHAETAHVLVVPPFDPAAYADRGAVGLLVPGTGATVSGEGARAALVRGRTTKAELGGVPSGPPKIVLAARPGRVTIYVSLPPPGRHANDRRYPIAIVGGGYHGLLHSTSTRIPGLVSIADVAPTALGDDPPVTAHRVPDAPARLHELDRRLTEQEGSRNWAVGLLALGTVAASLLAVATGSRAAGRAALLLAPLLLLVSIAISAAGGARPSVLLPALAAGAAGLAAAGSGVFRHAEALGAACAGLIAVLLVVLVARPVWPALAVLGPEPARGGRFYGMTNIMSTLMLTVALVAGSRLPLRALGGVALLSVVTVGWSRAGADGGGLVVFVVAFLVLWLRRARGRLTGRAMAVALAGAVAVGGALVAFDALTGGRSHVTRRLGEGPGAVLDELGNRLHISAERLVVSWHPPLVFAIGIAALVVLFARGPRFPAGEALIVATVVSLLINDSPNAVAAGAAVSYGVLWAWERINSRPCVAEP